MPLTTEERAMLVRIDDRSLEMCATVARVEGQVIALSSRVNTHINDGRAHPREEVRAVKRDQRDVRKKLESLTDEVADTGKHEVIELREGKKHTGRTIVTALISVALLALTVLVTLAVKGH